MPNHVRNKVTVIGDPARVKEFVDLARGAAPRPGDREGTVNYSSEEPKSEPFCFHKIIPLPKEYSQVPYSDQGYNMERAAWGVKWGAYDYEEHDDEEQPRMSRSGRCAAYGFTTAWSPPVQVIDAAASQFPDLKFLLSWGGEGPTRGRILWENGEANEEEVSQDLDDDESLSDNENSERYFLWVEETLNSHADWVDMFFTE